MTKHASCLALNFATVVHLEALEVDLPADHTGPHFERKLAPACSYSARLLSEDT